MNAGMPARSLSGMLFAVSVVLLGGVGTAIADCGYEDGKFADAGRFTAVNGGSLGMKFNSTYYLLRRDRCTKFQSNNTRLRFVVNHLDLTGNQQPAFITAHVALFNPRDTENVVWLYRNAKSRNNGWKDDTKPGDYESLHSDGTARVHPDFNTDLSGTSRDTFNAKYRTKQRTWMNRLEDGADGVDTWESRSGFAARSDLMRAAESGAGGLKVQNYLINFTTGDSEKEDPLKFAPDFSVDAGNAECVFVRISGSPNVRNRVSGEYTIALNNRNGCDSVIRNLRGIGFLEDIFNYRR